MYEKRSHDDTREKLEAAEGVNNRLTEMLDDLDAAFVALTGVLPAEWLKQNG